VTGDAARLVAPGDADALARALEAAVSDDAEVRRRRTLGLEVAARYTWEASARDHATVYRSLR